MKFGQFPVVQVVTNLTQAALRRSPYAGWLQVLYHAFSLLSLYTTNFVRSLTLFYNGRVKDPAARESPLRRGEGGDPCRGEVESDDLTFDLPHLNPSPQNKTLSGLSKATTTNTRNGMPFDKLRETLRQRVPDKLRETLRQAQADSCDFTRSDIVCVVATA